MIRQVAIFFLFALGIAVAQEPVVLQFWEGHSPQEEAATIEMIKAFEAANPDIQIERSKVNFGSNFEAITTAVASGTTPDVSPIWGGFLTQFADAGALLNLSEYEAGELAEEIYPAAWEFGQWNGSTYGIPYAIDPRFLVYNVDAFTEAGLTEPPANLQELVEYADALTIRQGNTVQQYGFAIGTGEDLLNTFINLLVANGGSVFNEDASEITFDSEAGVQAGQVMQTMVQNGSAVNQENNREAFLVGRVAMYIDGPWVFYDAANHANPPSFEIAALPAASADIDPTNVATVGAYVAYANTEHPEEAAQFVKFLASPEAQQYRVSNLKTGVARAVSEEPFAQETFAQTPALEQAQALLDDSVIYPIHPNWTRVVDALVPALDAIMSGEDPAQTLSTAARQASRALR